MKKDNRYLKALAAAFPHTIPILMGFSFLGMTYGIFMTASGFPWWYPCLTSVVVFAGSAEFVAVNLLLGAFDLAQAFFMTIMINARHVFYGISMLEKYKGMGLKKFYLIFGLCDESFSINCTANIPEDVDKGLFMLFVTILDHSYWVLGSSLGGIFGNFLHFNTTGLDFVMTAMFVVIFLEQWLKEKDHLSALIGLFVSTAALLVFGAESFLLPAMAGILLSLTLMRKRLEKGGVK
ncbi:MAG: AzlC family ABC transporter permease [Clostridia bacterium]|nr:AzlC family ABC transporter permease [Clostridia bacterium]